ncbi:chromate efflux transporter [Xanthobacter oligotrophicus]|uniref:chromate efflux transporter n=1 Tax=Xanthobacter oligotrophicus TaxID=2607286 RepID=UPI0011F1F095|nr:chromate efflux transporter [Xanthobacter oligotrophicus]MCG5237719.1 chromate efflux transporter [Xanthobacter oligotrophicus]
MTDQDASRARDAGPRDTGPRGTDAPPGSPGEVFGAFLKLGLTSFGGPVAHLGYFRDELVLRRRWMDDAAYGDLVALCQFLPGPASSQLGFALGLLRGGGLLGGLAAWAGFTLPSAIALTACALGAASLAGTDGVLHGLKLVAVAVVAQAVWGMTRTLTPDRARAGIALAALALVVFAGSALGQVAAIALGALAGLVLCAEAAPARGDVPGPEPTLAVPLSRRTGALLLALFAALLVVPPVVAAATGVQGLALFDAFYRSGALVFGGGHVVLPLLQAEVVAPGWVSASTFLAGYGLAQAVPGPLFTFAAYLGAAMGPAPNGIAGAAIALIAIFLPGLLLVTGMLPFWDQLRRRTRAQAAMRGANAAVVGLIGAALYSPVFTGAVFDAPDFVAAVAGFLLLTVWRVPPLAVVVLLAGAGVFLV